MLLQFSFKNFKSFRDDTVLDLTATKETEYNSHIINIANERVLPVAAIFGANASGKTKLVEAFEYMSSYVISSFGFGSEASNRYGKSEFIAPTPYLFDENSRDAESTFEVYFIEENNKHATTYNYGFSVNRTGVTEEWLNSKAKTAREYKRIFYRGDEGLELPGIPATARENIKTALEKEALIVSLGAKLKIEVLKHIREWFLNNETGDFGKPIKDLIYSFKTPVDFAYNKAIQNRVIEFFSSFDKSIVGFNIEVIKDDNGNKDELKIETVHRNSDSDKTYAIPLKEESAGTLKMFALFPMLYYVLNSGGVLVIDELNARLHPLLVRNFIIAFLNPKINTNHAQLIFTSHDTWQLNSNILRRDEIWFTEKAESGISTLYSLADFVDDEGSKIRKDENYEKNYLLGKYGAIPTLSGLNMFGEA